MTLVLDRIDSLIIKWDKEYRKYSIGGPVEQDTINAEYASNFLDDIYELKEILEEL